MNALLKFADDRVSTNSYASKGRMEEYCTVVESG